MNRKGRQVVKLILEKKKFSKKEKWEIKKNKGKIKFELCLLLFAASGHLPSLFFFAIWCSCHTIIIPTRWHWSTFFSPPLGTCSFLLPLLGTLFFYSYSLYSAYKSMFEASMVPKEENIYIQLLFAWFLSLIRRFQNFMFIVGWRQYMFIKQQKLRWFFLHAYLDLDLKTSISQEMS